MHRQPSANTETRKVEAVFPEPPGPESCLSAALIMLYGFGSGNGLRRVCSALYIVCIPSKK